MSYPNIPDINPDIEICREDVINILLASIGLEELSLAHIVNAEAEKIQYVLGTLNTNCQPEECPDIHDLLKINKSVERTLRNVIKNQMLLQFKLEDVLDIPEDDENCNRNGCRKRNCHGNKKVNCHENEQCNDNENGNGNGNGNCNKSVNYQRKVTRNSIPHKK